MQPQDRAEIRHLPLFRDMLQANFTALMQAAYAQRFPMGAACPACRMRRFRSAARACCTCTA